MFISERDLPKQIAPHTCMLKGCFEHMSTLVTNGQTGKRPSSACKKLSQPEYLGCCYFLFLFLGSEIMTECLGVAENGLQ